MLKALLAPRSLRGQLVWLVVAFTILPLLISNVVGYWHARRHLIDQASVSVGHVAALKAAELQSFVQFKRASVPTIVAANTRLATLMKAAAAGDPEASVLLTEHLEMKARESGARDFVALAPDGNSLATTPAGLPESAAACFRSAVAAGAHHELRFSNGQPLLFVAEPVPGERSTTLGMLCATFDDIGQQLQLVPALELPGGALWLLDASRKVMFSGSQEGPIGAAPQQAPEFDPARPWRGNFILPSGEAALAAAAPVRELGVAVFVAFPTATVLASVDRLMVQAGVSIGVLLVLLALWVLAVAQRLTRPLATLRDSAVRMASGARDEHVPVTGPDEVVELSHAFSAMSRAVKDSHELLEQRIAERTQALERSRAFAELLLDVSEQSIVVIGQDGLVRQANRVARRLFGAGVVGSRCGEVCSGCQNDALPCDVKRALTGNRRVVMERSQRVGSTQEILRTESFIIPGDGPEETAVLQLGRIVTAERQLQAQLIHQEKMAAFGLVAAGIAHDIGNPLAALESQLRVARASNDKEVTLHTLTIAEEHVARMSRLLRELVNLTRRRSEEARLVSVDQVVVDVVRLLKHDPRSRNVSFVETLAASSGVRAKEDQLWQVFLNLGINSLDSMPEGGTLSIATERHDDQIVIRVRDSGCGIPEEAMERVFEPFYTTKAAGKGTGLGLFVSKGVVESLGGSLVLEASSSQGTIFAVRLPAAVVSAARATA